MAIPPTGLKGLATCQSASCANTFAANSSVSGLGKSGNWAVIVPTMLPEIAGWAPDCGCSSHGAAFEGSSRDAFNPDSEFLALSAETCGSRSDLMATSEAASGSAGWSPSG